MRRPRIFVALDLDSGMSIELPEGPARHLIQVLRLVPGDALVLFNGDGHDYSARLMDARRGTVTVMIDESGEAEPAALVAIELAIGISKGDRMDYALQKAVELGVTRLIPLFTERSQIRLDRPRLERRSEHWRGILIGACEQSGRRRLPILDSATTFDAWLTADMPANGLLLDPLASLALTALPAPLSCVTLLVGPEGGLSPGEINRALQVGFRGVRLGPRILRTETAPLAAISVIQALWGDFRDDRSVPIVPQAAN
jgi:16S rRNA (uracil1498-N3)-methyltransferase